MKRKCILKRPGGDVYAPYSDEDFTSVKGNANTFNRAAATKKAHEMKKKHNLQYVIIQEVLL